MAERARSLLALAPAASQDLRDIFSWSEKNFGKLAANRYRALLNQAIRDVAANPELPGSRRVPDTIDGVRTYHLSLSRRHLDPPGVKEPRHLLLYRHLPDGIIQIGRILHESRDFARHSPEGYSL